MLYKLYRNCAEGDDCAERLFEYVNSKGPYGGAMPTNEEKWKWHGDELNQQNRRDRANNGDGTGNTLFFSILHDLTQFVEVRLQSTLSKNVCESEHRFKNAPPGG